jgi:hypothetical protein
MTCRFVDRLTRLANFDIAHGLTVSLPNRDKLTMRISLLKTLDLIPTLSRDEAKGRGAYSANS